MKTKTFLPLFINIILVLIIASGCKKKEDKKDTTAPIITILGANPYTVAKDSVYHDPGATATDDKDGDITSKIVVTSNVIIADTGHYQVRYNVSDNAGNAAVEKVRNVRVMVFK